MEQRSSIYFFLLNPQYTHAKQFCQTLNNVSLLGTAILLYSNYSHFLRICMPSSLAMSRITQSHAETPDDRLTRRHYWSENRKGVFFQSKRVMSQSVAPT